MKSHQSRMERAPSTSGIQSYRDLRVWQEAIGLVDQIYDLTNRLPRDERYGVTQQLRRAAVSVAANIAEGHARTHVGEFVYHLSVARGSTAEIEVLLLIVERRSYVEPVELEGARKSCDAIMRMITMLKRRLQPKTPRR